jgi:hypothetical protein
VQPGTVLGEIASVDSVFGRARLVYVPQMINASGWWCVLVSAVSLAAIWAVRQNARHRSAQGWAASKVE